tara:strand:- start:717 stop:938 length:222 start_codon:yes stop_codon:yes gene_type:complete
VIKRFLKLFWRGGVEESKPPFRQVLVEDEFSKKSLIGEDEEYKDMSDLVENFGEEQKQEEIDTIFNTLDKDKR